jgi:hypothetical protein
VHRNVKIGWQGVIVIIVKDSFMETIVVIERLKEIDRIIKKQATGNVRDLAKKLRIT